MNTTSTPVYTDASMTKREAILAYVKARPGSRPSEIAAALGIGDSEVFDIVDALCGEGKIGPFDTPSALGLPLEPTP